MSYDIYHLLFYHLFAINHLKISTKYGNYFYTLKIFDLAVVVLFSAINSEKHKYKKLITNFCKRHHL